MWAAGTGGSGEKAQSVSEVHSSGFWHCEVGKLLWQTVVATNASSSTASWCFANAMKASKRQQFQHCRAYPQVLHRIGATDALCRLMKDKQYLCTPVVKIFAKHQLSFLVLVSYASQLHSHN